MKTVACNLATCGEKSTQEVAEKPHARAGGSEGKDDAELMANYGTGISPLIDGSPKRQRGTQTPKVSENDADELTFGERVPRLRFGLPCERRRFRSSVYGFVSITNDCFAIPTTSTAESVIFSTPH
jgi:hypothetical protein